ncbi:hypothetical protein ACQEU3_39635 [Spirillospora sp. CA-253888]
MEHPAPAADAPRLSPSGLPWPDGWHRTRAHGRVRAAAAAVAGTALLVIAAWETIAASAPRDPSLGPAFAMAGLLCLMMTPLLIISRRRDAVFLGVLQEGEEEHRGVVFSMRPTFVPAVIGVLVTGGTASLLLSLTDDPGAGGDRTLAAIGVLMLLAGTVSFFRVRGFQGVVLTPDALVVRIGGPGRMIVPWTAVAEVTESDYGRGVPYIGLELHDQSPLKRNRWIRLNRLFGPDLTISVTHLRTDPALLPLAIRHYLNAADIRPELATKQAIDRLRAGRL